MYSPRRQFPVYNAIELQRVVPGEQGAIKQSLLPLDGFRKILCLEIDQRRMPLNVRLYHHPPSRQTIPFTPPLALFSTSSMWRSLHIFAFTNQRKCPESA